MRLPDLVAEVSRRHSRLGLLPRYTEGLNDTKVQVVCQSHGCKATEKQIQLKLPFIVEGKGEALKAAKRVETSMAKSSNERPVDGYRAIPISQ